MKDGSCLYLIFIATLFLCSVYCIPLNNLESDSKFLKEGVLEDLNDEFNCTFRCSIGEGLNVCDCDDVNPPIKIDHNLKIAEDLKIAEAMKTPENLEIIQKAKESNVTECQIKCESTGDGYPFCNCGNNVPPKSEKKEKIDIDCEELCENGDGFPFCDCSVIPDPKNGNKKPFSKHLNKKTLPIKLEKTRIKKP